MADNPRETAPVQDAVEGGGAAPKAPETGTGNANTAPDDAKPVVDYDHTASDTAKTVTDNENTVTEKEDKSEKKDNNRWDKKDHNHGKKGYNRWDKKDFKQHGRKYENKEDKKDEPPISDPVQIREQTEFYFSPFNLPKDDHMKDLIGWPDNNAVPLHTITNFTRMRRFGPFSAIVDAIKDSKVLELVDANSAEPLVKRRVPLESYKVTDEEKTMVESRFWGLYERQCSVYVKGFFPEDKVHPKQMQEEIENLYKPFGVKAVRLRREFSTDAFKGSIYISFEDKAAREEFMARDDKPTWGGNNMIYMRKEDYCVMKMVEQNIKPEDEKFPEFERGFYAKKKEKQARHHEFRHRRPDGNNSYKHKGRRYNDKDDWRTRRDNERKGNRSYGNNRKRGRDETDESREDKAEKKAKTEAEPVKEDKEGMKKPTKIEIPLSS